MSQKGTIAALSALLLFTACSGEDSIAACTETVQKGDYSLCLPSGWEEVPAEVLRQRNVPEETVGVFRLADPRGSQRDNIVVSREFLPGSIASKSYAETNIKTIEVTPEYTLLEKREVTVDDKDSLLHIFSAKPAADLPARRFYQLSLTEGTNGYTITATLPFSTPTEIEEAVVTSLLSVALGSGS